MLDSLFGTRGIYDSVFVGCLEILSRERIFSNSNDLKSYGNANKYLTSKTVAWPTSIVRSLTSGKPSTTDVPFYQLQLHCILCQFVAHFRPLNMFMNQWFLLYKTVIFVCNFHNRRWSFMYYDCFVDLLREASKCIMFVAFIRAGQPVGALLSQCGKSVPREFVWPPNSISGHGLWMLANIIFFIFIYVFRGGYSPYAIQRIILSHHDYKIRLR